MEKQHSVITICYSYFLIMTMIITIRRSSITVTIINITSITQAGELIRDVQSLRALELEQISTVSAIVYCSII